MSAPTVDDPSLMEEIAIDDSDDYRPSKLGSESPDRVQIAKEHNSRKLARSDAGEWKTDDSWDEHETSVQNSNGHTAWKPLTAAMTSPKHNSLGESEQDELHRLRDLEEEQEQLNLSLLALTTHFAQVQFRLQQISKAPPDEKERLLKSLEEFAFKGCPDLASARANGRLPSDASAVETEAECRVWKWPRALMTEQRAKQLQLIGQLRDQLEDLERFAYEAGTAGLPSVDVMERQRMFIDQLRAKLDLDVDGIDRLGPDELQRKVDTAVKRLINPLRAKDQLVQQLQTQITDLERFVEFLQIESGASKGMPCSCDKDRSKCAAHNGTAAQTLADIVNRRSFGYTKNLGDAQSFNAKGAKNYNNALSTLALVQMHLLANLGCQSNKFHKNELKRSIKGNHWGDLRAALELAADHLHQVSEKHENEMSAQKRVRNVAGANDPQLSAYESDDEDVDDIFDKCHEEVVTAVRKYFCPALRDLLQHGMLPLHANVNYAKGDGSALSALSCLPNRRRNRSGAPESKVGEKRDPPRGTSVTNAQSLPHAWLLLTQYYDMKHGREMSEAPARKLTQSFGLEGVEGEKGGVAGGRAVTSRQMLLSTIESIQGSHEKLNRSQDAMFKAFICAALNQKKLVPWMRMILRTHDLIEENFYPWSYVSKTGFDDTLMLLEKFSKFDYNLPVDLAVRPLGVRECPLVAGTNDSSTFSKRSLHTCGYSEDHTLDQICEKLLAFGCNGSDGKVKRRSPLINRGYFLRTISMQRTVERFVQIHSLATCQVISLGAGFDTLFSRQPLRRHTTYIELDLPSVVETKRKVINSSEKLSAVFAAPGYHLIGVDLCDQDAIEDVLQRHVERSVPTLCFAECSLVYLAPEKSNKALAKLQTYLQSNMTVLLYEQIRPDDAFGAFMLSHFEKRQTPLLGVRRYKNESEVAERLASLNFRHTKVITLASWVTNEMAGGAKFPEPEPFDEYEMLAMKCNHYVIAVGAPDQEMLEKVLPTFGGYLKMPQGAHKPPHRISVSEMENYCHFIEADEFKRYGHAAAIRGEDFPTYVPNILEKDPMELLFRQ